ncbi:hypothetical protein [Micromonospora tarensis]|uniref:Uncharacterized protein n=1 Tax=Micromonospora tarensis TaxID=2806100 RepID=A0ABS1YH68_9ACTN|nr:hypothetical protein [Micromonospora tarensis]MBM0276742.1 hypothetical protein [Micromonospora tarensis]
MLSSFYQAKLNLTPLLFRGLNGALYSHQRVSNTNFRILFVFVVYDTRLQSTNRTHANLEQDVSIITADLMRRQVVLYAQQMAID